MGRVRLSLPNNRIWILPGVLILAAVVVLLIVSQSNSKSSGSLQTALWNSYLANYWHSNGQVMDPANNNVTTSEAEGYTLLRAVWQNDPQVFSTTWQWTANHMQRSDKLFSWLWGSLDSSSNGVMANQGGQNTASDADTDIAFALVMASGRWGNQSYLQAAEAIIPAIWNEEVVTIKGQPYLTADNLESASPTPLLNPSYFEPYAYRVFANLDSSHAWLALVNQSYTTIQAASQQQLGSPSSDNLPPDWVAINKQTGQLLPPASSNSDTNFGFNAFRVIWRTALDWQWNHDPAAKNSLALFNALLNSWSQNHKLYAIYAHNGQPTVNYSSTALYGGTLSYFSVIHPEVASAIYNQELAPLYNPTTQRLNSKLNYYDNNWAWFGVALYNNQLKEYLPSGVHS